MRCERVALHAASARRFPSISRTQATTWFKLNPVRVRFKLARPVVVDGAIGRVTRIDAIQQQQMAFHARRRLQIQLEQIRAALHRLSEGSYGECTICGERILAARLDLAPETPVCVMCQRQLD